MHQHAREVHRLGRPDALAALEANYQGTSVDPVTPLLGLRQRFGNQNVSYAQGAPLSAGVPVMIPETALRSDGKVGLKGEYFDNRDLAGKPRVVRQDRVVSFNWDQVAPAPGVNKDRYSVRWTGELLPPGPGDYTLAVRVARCFDCTGHDPVRLYVDDELVIAGNAEDKHVAAGVHNADGRNVETQLHFEDARPRRIRLEIEHQGQDQGLRLEWLAPAGAQLAEAERAVAQADAVVAFVGLSPDVEGEELKVDVLGFDGGMFMPYLTAGLAVANATHLADIGDGEGTATHVGGTVGAGVKMTNGTTKAPMSICDRFTCFCAASTE